MAKHISLSDDTYHELMNVVGDLVKEKQKPISISEAIQSLVDEHYQKKAVP